VTELSARYKFKPAATKTDGELWIDFYTAALHGSLVHPPFGLDPVALAPTALAQFCGILADAALGEVLERRGQTPHPDALTR
jgi:hypothetical protein